MTTSGLKRTRATLRPVRRWYRELRSPVLRRDRVDTEHLRLLLAFSLREESCCVDVGANEGSVLALILRYSPNGRHTAFEPIPPLAAALRNRFPTVDVREAALSASAGTADFVFVKSRPALSGLRERSYSGPVEKENLTVRTERLDDIIPAGSPVDLLKIDVEGGELGVLEGGMRTITDSRPLIVLEHGAGGADHYGTTPQQVFRLLCTEAGLTIFDMDGNGPYEESEFARTSTHPQGRWNWIARPYRS